MTIILEHLLLLARLDAQSGIVETNLASLPTIIDESLAHFKSHIARKNLTIEFFFDQKKEYSVPQYYTNLIVDNLMSNAIKYSNQGSVIKINLREESNHITFTIQDEGVGIKEEDTKYIYENFFRSDALNHKEIPGNGLGLSIVKKSADAINAKVKIESKEKKGTVVYVTFLV